ncbi:MAG: DUF3656 domain-containing U32 family peptidase [Coriobacteriales bacterium]|jgi:collagenase-like PrtC family protease
MRKPELLAPAGNRAAFEAALGAGADAIYLGAGAFNARRNADNFTLEDLRASCRDAHLRGCRVYLTANTLVFPGEMGEAMHTVSTAAEAGIDAAIVQDVGLMSMLARDLPELPLHTSTQMNIRDANGIEIARKLGACRVTLARELSIEKIAELAKLGMDLECFVHGALCICQSGQCLLSSLVGGRSANRGLCAQPCRLPYKLIDAKGKQVADPGPYLLSPKDLAGISVLDRLVAAGVASLKIEGRMKSPEYVSAVVGAYREALDRACEDPMGYELRPEETDALSEAFSRGFSTAYLTGERGNAMMGYKRPNNRGVAVGRVGGFEKGKVKVKLSQALEVGDLLQVWASKGNVTYTVAEDDKLSDRAALLAIKGAVSPGDRIFRVRSAELSRNARQRTEAGLKIPVAFTVTAHIGKPLSIEVRDMRGHSASIEGQPVEAARTRAITREDVIEHVGRLGSTPFSCNEWNVELDEGVGLGFSALHKLRSAVLARLAEAILADYDAQRGNPGVPELDFSGVEDLSDMSAFATSIDFADTDIACELGQFEPGCTIGPRLYATNLEALQTWAALGATFAWLSPELTLRQIARLAQDSPIPLGIIVSGRQELMVSDHCFLMAMGPCDERCASCKRRKGQHFLEDRKRYRLPVTTDLQGRGHIYNAVPLDTVHAVPDLRAAGVAGFAVDATLMSEKEAQAEVGRVRSALKGTAIEKREGTTTGHLFRQVR